MKVRFESVCILVYLFVLVTAASSWAAEPGGAPDGALWTPEKSALVRTVSGLQVSPDGKWAAFEVRQAVIDGDKNEYITQIWIAATDGSGASTLTNGEKSSTSPAWSPDGKELAYVSSRSGKDNVWLMDPFSKMEKRLTDVTMGVGSFKWSRDGKKIALVMPDMPSKEQLASATAKGPKFVDQNSKVSLNIWVVDTAVPEGFAKETSLTSGKWIVTGLDWSPDGKTIAFSHQPRPGQEFVYDNDISSVNVATGEIKPLVSQPGWDLSPTFSPDGKYIAFSSAEGDSSRLISRYHIREGLVPSGGGPVRYLAATPNKLANSIGWIVDGSGIYVGEPTRTTELIYFLPVDGGTPREFFRPKGDLGNDVSFSKDQGT